jgi:hypothetical protein
MYGRTNWLDHAVSPANHFNVSDNQDGTKTITPAGEVIQQGTNMSAVNFNNIEEGVCGAYFTALEAAQAARMAASKADGVAGIVLTSTLTNTAKYPFNNSVKTIALSGANMRYTKDYTVTVEVTEYSGGCVGDIIVSDKLLNGFKVAYTGSATSVSVKIYVQGGV